MTEEEEGRRNINAPANPKAQLVFGVNRFERYFVVGAGTNNFIRPIWNTSYCTMCTSRFNHPCAIFGAESLVAHALIWLLTPGIIKNADENRNLGQWHALIANYGQHHRPVYQPLL